MACSAAVALSGCGAREAEVVKGAFEQPINSASVSLALSAQSTEGTMKLTLDGPYKSNGTGELPSADLALKLEGAMPRTIEGRLISTGKNAFIEYGGETYEVGEEQIAALKQQGASGAPTQLTPSDIQKLMGTMQDWFPNSDTQEDADLDGEPVTRVTGKLDLSEALKRPQGTRQEAWRSPAPRPSRSSATATSSASSGWSATRRFTIDVGRSDGKLRRIVAR